MIGHSVGIGWGGGHMGRAAERGQRVQHCSRRSYTSASCRDWSVSWEGSTLQIFSTRSLRPGEQACQATVHRQDLCRSAGTRSRSPLRSRTSSSTMLWMHMLTKMPWGVLTLSRDEG